MEKQSTLNKVKGMLHSLFWKLEASKSIFYRGNVILRPKPDKTSQCKNQREKKNP